MSERKDETCFLIPALRPRGRVLRGNLTGDEIRPQSASRCFGHNGPALQDAVYADAAAWLVGVEESLGLLISSAHHGMSSLMADELCELRDSLLRDGTPQDRQEARVDSTLPTADRNQKVDTTPSWPSRGFLMDAFGQDLQMTTTGIATGITGRLPARTLETTRPADWFLPSISCSTFTRQLCEHLKGISLSSRNAEVIELPNQSRHRC
ncbi:uncharacterized protein J3D65DRAFT_332655 [Phyllosticta citribraziliensis]|uniref:Uncharacterized protein n=1 Tax=Phyllosticta citribraziliensis TaxID=989973 RepID=A0ABR1LTR5_9PEZI